MGKSSPSAPAAPNPAATAAAQTQSNKDTALYTFGLNNPNVTTPLGSNTYSISNTTPTYNMDAYNKALSAWQTSGQSSGNNGDNGNPYEPNSLAWRNYNSSHASGGSSGPMPQLSDFASSTAGNPSVQQTISLSPEQQKLYDQNTKQSIDLSSLAGQLQGRVGDTLNQPAPGSADFATASKNAQDAYYNNQKQYLDPQFSQAQETMDAKLANQGITMGSQAYNNEQGNFARQKQSAYDTAQNNAILQGPQNAQQLFSLSTAAREQPLTEFNALRTGAQPQMPSFNPTQPSSMQPTNIAGITQQGYQNSLNGYNQQVAANNQMTQGLFGLGGSALGAYGQYAGKAALAGSDIRLKENIRYLGQERGHAVYAFNYISDPEKVPYRGVMAQEVAISRPDAVVDNGEYLMVDYRKLGIEFGRIH